MSNLISTFIEVVSADGERGRLADALRAMNAELGTSSGHNRLREWERGDRQPTAQVVDYMLGIVLPVLLAQESIGAKRANAFIKKCRLPAK